ncbi:hypothetical protein COO91_01703 [Nostoc flagelliforme CCNUN1]|uniref:Uncharacterized protein n=1 Tax=Nostoc flagelliforme CCNUN1 TaxID=2038116 RepID=A0A2K8SK52_9NOSO|nr:hypothetical protein COO91_01703 [Nostoc flagelliforme CCNUN1]
MFLVGGFLSKTRNPAASGTQFIQNALSVYQKGLFLPWSKILKL